MVNRCTVSFVFDTVGSTENEVGSTMPIYQYHVGGAYMTLRFEDNGASYTSDDDASRSWRSVEQHSSDYGSFQIGTVGADTMHFGTANISFYSELLGNGIPQALNLFSSTGQFMYTFARNNGDGGLLIVSGNVDTLEVVADPIAVPEPESVALLLAGIVGIGINKRLRPRRNSTFSRYQ